jgi:hypothetical protein
VAIRFIKFLIVLGAMFLSQKIFCQIEHLHVAGAKAILNREVFNPPATTREENLIKVGAPALGKFSLLSGYEALVIPQDHYVKNLAFFCRQEVKFEKSVRIPLRFRVGSLEQCNKLEGK